MRRRLPARPLLLLALAHLAACGDDARERADRARRLDASAPVLVGAGDIATCDGDGDEDTAALLDTIPGTVVALGDNAYPHGSAEDFEECYGPSWGRHAWRTRPALGNHEYDTPSAAGHFAYFGERAGPPGAGYYSYDVGEWHVVVLNSVLDASPGSAQFAWLRRDLAANRAACTAAYWHHPRFSSSRTHGSDARSAAVWRVLYDAGVDVVLGAHDHQYERFAPQTPDGERDPERGIRQFVVGTGGGERYRFGRALPNSEARIADAYGVLRLDLRDDGYAWTFIDTGGEARDTGEAECH